MMNDIGSILQETRAKKGLTIKEVTLSLKIRKEYIIALEENNIDCFISKTYYYGYLKQYLKLLDLDDKNIHSNKEINKSQDITQDAAKEPDLSIDTPILERLSPNLLFTIIVIILGIIVYNLCDEFITKKVNDPITSEINRKINHFVEL